MNRECRRRIEDDIESLIRHLLCAHQNPNEFMSEILEQTNIALESGDWSLYPDGIWCSNIPWRRHLAKLSESVQ